MGAITAELVETGEKRDVCGRRAIPRAQRMKLIEDFATSGVTMAEFARRESINYTTFAGWMAKAGKVPAGKSAIKFAELKLPTMRRSLPEAAMPLEVRLADGTVVRGVCVADVTALVQALRS